MAKSCKRSVAAGTINIVAAEAEKAERRRAEIELMRASLLQEDWDKIRQFDPTFDSMTAEQQYGVMRNTRELRMYGPEDDGLWG